MSDNPLEHLRRDVDELLMHHRRPSIPNPVRVVPRPGGRGGFDVVVTVDGGYSLKSDAEHVAEMWSRVLYRVLLDLDQCDEEVTR